MGRLKELRHYVDGELEKMEDSDKRNGAIVHLYGVSLAAVIHHTLNDPSKQVEERETERYKMLCGEFGL